MDTYFLKSERLWFRTWTFEDLALAIQLWGDEKVTHFIDARGKLTADQVKERLSNEIASMGTYCVQYWPVFLLENDQFIGCCGLRLYNPEENVFELGVHLCSDQWRKGYASEAAVAVVRYAFDTLNVRSLFAGHHPQNISSRYLLQKIGFRYIRDEFYAPTGLLHPSYLMKAEEFIKETTPGK